MALFRALEGSLPAGERLFADPWARRFLSAPLRAVAEVARLPGLAGRVCRFIDGRWPGARSSAAARPRFLDERIEEAVSRGARQIVLLGAGFDARALRMLLLGTCTVYELDHPATQERKRRRLGAHCPANVRFVPIDFQRDRLAEAIAARGFDERQRSLVLWEGVTNYLTQAAVEETLRWCARAAPGSEVLFTYVHERVLREPTAFFGTAELFHRLRATSEEWTFGLDPLHLQGFLHACGLELIEDVGASDYRARYFGSAAETMRGYEFYRIASARVPLTATTTADRTPRS
jgi:methyltransferase (TIGR00027 family)